MMGKKLIALLFLAGCSMVEERVCERQHQTAITLSKKLNICQTDKIILRRRLERCEQEQ